MPRRVKKKAVVNISKSTLVYLARFIRQQMVAVDVGELIDHCFQIAHQRRRAIYAPPAEAPQMRFGNGLKDGVICAADLERVLQHAQVGGVGRSEDCFAEALQKL